MITALCIYAIGLLYVVYDLNWGSAKTLLLEIDMKRKQFLNPHERQLAIFTLAAIWPALVLVGAVLLGAKLIRRG